MKKSLQVIFYVIFSLWYSFGDNSILWAEESRQLLNFPEPTKVEGLLALSESPKVEIKQIKVLGSTVFSEADLAAVTASFIGKQASFSDLLVIAQKITDLYVSRGYLTSGAFLPPQQISATEGVVVIQVIEGKLESLEIRGLKRLQESYVRSRLEEAAEPPLNVYRLEESLQLLQINPLFEQIKAELKQGSAPNLSILEVNLQEAPSWSIGLQFDNYQSPSVGEYQGTFSVDSKNLLGFGDRLFAQYNLTEGLDKVYLDYAIPINAQNGTLKLRYQKGDSEIIQQPFAELDLDGDYQKAGLEWRQPLIQSLENELALSVIFDWQQSQSFLLGRPFSFIPAIPNGAYRISSLRFGQEWVNRSVDSVLALRSQFSLGLDFLSATVTENEPDASFFAWQGQLQWIEKLDEEVIFSWQLSAQLTGDSLLPAEQFPLGGIYTVRGYDYNLRRGDNGFNASVEVRFPLIDGDWGRWELIPFVDVGAVWNNQELRIPEPNTLASVGLGLSGQIGDSLFVRLDYAFLRVDVEPRRNFSVEESLSFSIVGRWKF